MKEIDLEESQKKRERGIKSIRERDKKGQSGRETWKRQEDLYMLQYGKGCVQAEGSEKQR